MESGSREFQHRHGRNGEIEGRGWTKNGVFTFSAASTGMDFGGIWNGRERERRVRVRAL